MNLPTYCAVVEGYQDHLFDLKCISVSQGFWAGYYSNAKRPKPLQSILNTMLQEHQKSKKRRSRNQLNRPKPEVDVETFLERERKFKAAHAKLKGGS